MKKKCLLIVNVVLVFSVLCGIGINFNWKYFYAGIRYGGKSAIGSEILFSKASGFYEDEFYLKIYAPSKEIYYTLDGSEPTKDSVKYENAILIDDASNRENTNSMREDFSTGFLLEDPVYEVPNYLIDKCTILKVAYYDEKGNKSQVEERVYFVDFEEKTGYENINIISITSDPENLFSDEKGIYVLGDTYQWFLESGSEEEKARDWCFWAANYRNHGRSWEREANITVFNVARENVLTQKVGIRTQGGASRGYYPKSINIYARDEYGDNRLRYDFWGTGYYPKRMTLSCGGNDNRGKMMDRLVSELTEKADFGTMNYEPYVLFLNGEYWGFYYLTEKYDEQYLEHYYDVNRDNVIIIKNGSIEVGTDTDAVLYAEMIAFVENADMAMDENYQSACAYLDMQSLIEYFATEIYIARELDWPSSNYALWRVRETGNKECEDGKWRWLLFDVNTSALNEDLIEHDTLAYARKKSKLFGNLWNSQQFRESFAETILEMSETIFRENLVRSKISEYEELMYTPVQKHCQRFFGKTFEGKYPTATSIKNFVAQRADYISIMLEANMSDI